MWLPSRLSLTCPTSHTTALYQHFNSFALKNRTQHFSLGNGGGHGSSVLGTEADLFCSLRAPILFCIQRPASFIASFWKRMIFHNRTLSLTLCKKKNIQFKNVFRFSFLTIYQQIPSESNTVVFSTIWSSTQLVDFSYLDICICICICISISIS